MDICTWQHYSLQNFRLVNLKPFLNSPWKVNLNQNDYELAIEFPILYYQNKQNYQSLKEINHLELEGMKFEIVQKNVSSYLRICIVFCKISSYSAEKCLSKAAFKYLQIILSKLSLPWIQASLMLVVVTEMCKLTKPNKHASRYRSVCFTMEYTYFTFL